MDAVLEDRYVVFLRVEREACERRECDEEPLATCDTYEEARQLWRRNHEAGRDCVIRYVGTAGGGD
jgi:hypothetical protein